MLKIETVTRYEVVNDGKSNIFNTKIEAHNFIDYTIRYNLVKDKVHQVLGYNLNSEYTSMEDIISFITNNFYLKVD